MAVLDRDPDCYCASAGHPFTCAASAGDLCQGVEQGEFVIFDGQVCDHPVSNGFGQCAGCGMDFDA